MVTYMDTPQFKVTVTHGVTDYTYTREDAVNLEVTRRESGWDIATILMADYQSKNYSDKVTAGDAIVVEVKDASDASYEKIFSGIIQVAQPTMSPDMLMLKCDGAGYGFGVTYCGQDYGTQSSQPSIDTMKKVITNASYGILPKWVESILGTATSSGFDYDTQSAAADDLIEDIAGTIRYLYYPYKPCDKALNDLLELVQAIKGTNAGPHWIVTPDDEFIVSTIGSHHAVAVTEGWTNYYGGSAAAGTVVQGVDFTSYTFQKLDKEANYVLYYGKFKQPAHEVWTETASASWDIDDVVAPHNATLSDAAGAGPPQEYVQGSNSVLATSDAAAGDGVWFWYPKTGTLNLDLTKIGGEYNIPTISFWCMVDGEAILSAGSTPVMRLVTGALGALYGPDRYAYTLGSHLVADKWRHVVMPVGPYANSYPYSGTDLVADKAGNGDWADIDYIVFGFMNNAANAAKMYIDGLKFNGWVLRAARQTAAYSSSDPVKMKVVTDDVAKDDLLRSGTPGTTDLGTMARMCKAEYLRASTTPLVGKYTTPMIKDLWPGMLMHVHAKKKSDGTFNVDSDMRVVKLVHTMSDVGFLTTCHVTSDVKNSHARVAYNDLNRVLADARPEYQDKQTTTIKMREIDITQTIFEESY